MTENGTHKVNVDTFLPLNLVDYSRVVHYEIDHSKGLLGPSEHLCLWKENQFKLYIYMAAYICHHLSDNYVDLSDSYVDVSVI